jgi:hypothetical protein
LVCPAVNPPGGRAISKKRGVMAKTTDEKEQYESVCRSRFDEIIDKLDSLNSRLFIGNGQPSMMVRLDRLEQCKQSTSKTLWIAVTAFVTAAAGAIWEMFFQKNQ